LTQKFKFVIINNASFTRVDIQRIFTYIKEALFLFKITLSKSLTTITNNI